MKDEPKPVMIRERLDVCELDRARMALMNPVIIEQKREEWTIDENAKPPPARDGRGCSGWRRVPLC